MTIFKAHAVDDEIYIEAPNHEDAYEQLCYHFGQIPSSLIVWTAVDALPEGEELLPDVRG